MRRLIFCISDESFDGGSTLELLFNIRPRAQSGLLLYVGDPIRTLSTSVMGHFLTVYMLRGEVRMDFCLFLSKQIAVWIWSVCSQEKYSIQYLWSVADVLPLTNNNVVVCRWWFKWTKEEENLWSRWNRKRLCVMETFIKFQVKPDLICYFDVLNVFAQSVMMWMYRV